MAAREFVGAARPARTQRISAADAAALVRSGDWVEYGAGMGQPDVFDSALAERVDELEDVKIRALPDACGRARCSRPTLAASTSTGSTGTTPATTARRATPAAPTTSRATSARSRTTTGVSSTRPRSP